MVIGSHHIGLKLKEVRYFHDVLHELDRKHREWTALGRPAFGGEGGQIATIFQYNFSAYLSAHRAARYYIIRYSSKVPNSAPWRRSIDDNLVMYSLHHLRDVDIHDETLNLSSTVTMTNLNTPKAEVKLSGIELHSASLTAVRRLRGKPRAISYLTQRPVIEIVEEGFRELDRVFREALTGHYI